MRAALKSDSAYRQQKPENKSGIQKNQPGTQKSQSSSTQNENVQQNSHKQSVGTPITAKHVDTLKAYNKIISSKVPPTSPLAQEKAKALPATPDGSKTTQHVPFAQQLKDKITEGVKDLADGAQTLATKVGQGIQDKALPATTGDSKGPQQAPLAQEKEKPLPAAAGGSKGPQQAPLTQQLKDKITEGVKDLADGAQTLATKVGQGIQDKAEYGVTIDRGGLPDSDPKIKKIKETLDFFKSDPDGSKLLKAAGDKGVNIKIDNQTPYIAYAQDKTLAFGKDSFDQGIPYVAEVLGHELTHHTGNKRENTQNEEALASTLGRRIRDRYEKAHGGEYFYDNWYKWSDKTEQQSYNDGVASAKTNDAYKNLKEGTQIFNELARLGINFNINQDSRTPV